jgi:hypothetical protein
LFASDDENDTNAGSRTNDAHQQEECSDVHTADTSQEITCLARHGMTIELGIGNDVNDGNDEDDF